MYSILYTHKAAVCQNSLLVHIIYSNFSSSSNKECRPKKKLLRRRHWSILIYPPPPKPEWDKRNGDIRNCSLIPYPPSILYGPMSPSQQFLFFECIPKDSFEMLRSGHF